ncbi:peptidoglycan/LPS O-acetylase OafA/YrhL [Chitinophaga dinghuensis]|uniref:Peptidoglycan/LPS O-acetylase OafA/YrhL n=1 Tax=Chitinophaga dinghuensis TaxID=1539050 RepID=A0A327VPB8_9BACT|nr:acyltransferase family protein [Chitinophaga dinghuensis]RAJ75683.1 peptidoglycan/LPS O-acetylase OafA/YrhL [Chitinophaga dinghuensis]
MQPLSTSRQVYLDWLRILAIFGVLLFHSARPFAENDPWHVNNATYSSVLSEFSFWLSRFRMHLLFFVSGTVTWFMLQKRDAGQFTRLRIRRLLVPLLFGMLIIVPPQVYMERLTQGYKGNFWSFYPSIFDFTPYPKGNTSWHHLWFICYLIIYDIALAPVFAWATGPKGLKFRNSLAALASGKRIYLIIIPSVIWFTATVLKFPGTNDLVHDWCYFFYWLTFLVAGFICMLQPALMESLERNRRFSLSMAFLLLVLINYFRWNKIELDWEHVNWVNYLYIARQPLHSWLWVFALVGYGRKYLNKKLPIQDYLNQAVYPFYILHQTVIVIVAYYVVKTDDTIGLKYLFIVITSLGASMLIYHLFIRPFPVMRWLFGMKAIEEKKVIKEAPKAAPFELIEEARY